MKTPDDSSTADTSMVRKPSDESSADARRIMHPGGADASDSRAGAASAVQLVPEATAEVEEIPNKLYFRIGEVARLAGIKPYVLRFWETEFPDLGPKKSGTGHRLYRRKDVETVLEIKRLLYEQRFTIEGARKFLETQAKAAVRSSAKPVKAAEKPVRQPGLFEPAGPDLGAVRKELREILELLK